MNSVDLSEISRAIQVRHLAIPINDATSARPDERLGSVSRRLRAAQFGYAPVLVQGVPVGLIAQTASRPRALVSSVMRPLDESLLVSADTSLSELPVALAVEPFLFVLKGRRLTGFVTPADMGAVPARTHYYLMLSELELLLADVARRQFEDQTSALDILTAGRRLACQKLLRELRRLDELLDVVAALSLVDLIPIARQVPGFVEATRANGRSWNWLTKGFGDFRNDVMHPVREFARATQAGMLELAKFDERVRTLSDAAREVLGRHERVTGESG